MARDQLKGIIKGENQVRVVAHSPRRRMLMALIVALVCAGGAAGGFYLGESKAGLDVAYVEALERLDQGNKAEIAELRSRLVDADLARNVDSEAARELRDDIRALRDEVAGLQEEVTFYKSIMAPDSIERGLQIAEFQITPGEMVNEFTYHLLLTQVEARRDWVQGTVTLDVVGRRTLDPSREDVELVLSLTEIAKIDTYPLSFRFRYFQDLTGSMKLPDEFLPEAVVVTARRRGARSERLQQKFAWATSEAE
ncbi:MAG: hypothetical protein GWM88_15560 [Pseudomonadales bacterium]|nr:hypothetical protein [Pseudomonadales bacterium]NIX09351.1 hypothetical protein [Pseudomonadales bacterium]